jgi:Mg2+ and Co2+ transporter CorA
MLVSCFFARNPSDKLTHTQFHFQPTPHPQNVRRRIKQFKDSITVTSDWISYALIDDITDTFRPLIQSIEYEVDSIDELVLILKGVEQTDMLRRIGTCRKKVMGLLRLIGSKADVVKSLAKRYNENWRMAPTSDIVRFFLPLFPSLPRPDATTHCRASIYPTFKTI